MKAANSRGVSCACSVCSHKVQCAHAPMDFDEHESDWFKANVELMISRLKDDEWAKRGLPITPAVDIGGSSTSVRGRVIAQARAGWPRLSTLRRRRLHVTVPCARTNTHTHSLTLPAKAERAGALPCTRARIH